MTAEEIDYTVVGGTIGAGSAVSGTGLVSAIVEATSTENDDWIILDEFSEIKMALAVTIASNVHTAEPVTVDATTKNKIVFHAGGTDLVRILVYGTPA